MVKFELKEKFNFDIDKDVSVINETGHFPYFENNIELNKLLLSLINDFN